MAVLDINSLQYRNAPKSGDYNGDFEKYLVQSLANLGQRIGVKGDSIKTGSFSFIDLFDEAKSKYYSSDYHVGVIERRYGVMNMSIVPKSTLSVGNGESAIEHTISTYGNTMMFETAKEIKSSINTIDSYCKDSFISNIKNNKCVFCGIGQKYNNDGTFTKKEFVYEEYDRDSNSLVSGLRIFLKDNKVLLVTFNRIDSNNVDIEIFTVQSNTTSIEPVLSKIETLLYSLKGNKLINSVSNEARINSMSVNYWIDYLKLPRYGNNYDIISITYPFGSELEARMFSSEDIQNILSKHNLDNGDLYLFLYDKRDTLPILKQYFTDSLYASSKNSFREQILQAIFNAIYPSFPNNAKVYIPIYYTFNYYCNSNDSWKIYGGIQDINVRFVNTTISKYNIKTYYNEDQLLAHVNGDNQTSLYNYSVQYDPENDNFVYSVNVEKKYTLPYINSDNFWVINNQITNICAAGKDAGNPNIVIVYNFNKSDESILNRDFKILVAADKDSVLSTIGWKTVSTRVEPIEQINIEDPSVLTKSDMYTICCRVPNLSGTNNESQYTKALNILEYSLIVNISAVSCFNDIDNDIIKRYGDYGVVTTMWKYDAKSVSFSPITNPLYDGVIDNVALDIVNLTNLNNLVKWHIMNHEPKHPHKYTHQWLVLDNAKQETKNSINDYRTNVYPVIQNKTAEQVSVANYNNDFNLTVKFNDAVSGAQENDIRGILNSRNRYLSTRQINTTNNIYYSESGITARNYEDYVPNSDMPSLTLSEVLTRDINIVNRTNILSFDQNGYMFYSYIGSSFDDIDKNRVHIGGAETNINIGNETMVSNSNRKLFQRPKELHLDFENSFINGYSYTQNDIFAKQDIITSHINWEVRNMTNYINGVYSTTFIPTSKLMNQPSGSESFKPWMTHIQFNNKNVVRFADDNKYEPMTDGQIRRYAENAPRYISYFSNEHDYKLWIPLFYYSNNKQLFKIERLHYLGEGIYIPGLLGRLRLSKWNTNLNNVFIKTNMEVVKYSNMPIILISSNKFLSDNIEYTNKVSNSASTTNVVFNINPNELFTGNPLEIAYYELDNNLHITINEIKRNTPFTHLFKLKTEY